MAGEKDQVEPPITINIGNVCDGAFVDAFELKLQEVLKNIADPSTEARAKREIRLVLKLHPKDDRTQINVEFTCESKLAGLMPATSRMFVGKDAEGSLYALTEDPRQMNIFTPPKPVEAPAVIQFKTAGE
jgi:hypothetical protein